MSIKADRRIKIRRTADRKRTDRVKKAERERMLRLRNQGKTMEEIALELDRSERTVSKQLQKAQTEKEQTDVSSQTSQKEVDPLIAKELAEHMSNIRSLIEELSHIVYTIDIHHIDDFNENSIYSVEEHPLFASLRKHLLKPILWQDYDTWRTKYFEYVRGCDSLINKIRDEGRSWRRERRDLKVLYILEGFQGLILDRIQYINPWKGMFGRESSDWRDSIDYSIDKYEPEEYDFRCDGDIGKQALLADGYRVLIAEDAMAVSNAFQSMANHFLSGDKVTNLRILFYDLRALEGKIQKSLQDSLIRCDYILSSCKLCPASPIQDDDSRIRGHDERIVRDSDSVMSEMSLGSFLYQLDAELSYYNPKFTKVREFLGFFNCEDNKYIDAEIRRLCDEMCGTLHSLVDFLRLSFTKRRRRAGNGSNIRFQLRTRQPIIRSGEVTTQPTLEDTLHQLSRDCNKAYSAYRAAVREILYAIG